MWTAFLIFRIRTSGTLLCCIKSKAFLTEQLLAYQEESTV
jgi:hypothetical protein